MLGIMKCSSKHWLKKLQPKPNHQFTYQNDTTMQVFSENKSDRSYGYCTILSGDIWKEYISSSFNKEKSQRYLQHTALECKEKSGATLHPPLIPRLVYHLSTKLLHHQNISSEDKDWQCLWKKFRLPTSNSSTISYCVSTYRLQNIAFAICSSSKSQESEWSKSIANYPYLDRLQPTGRHGEWCMYDAFLPLKGEHACRIDNILHYLYQIKSHCVSFLFHISC